MRGVEVRRAPNATVVAPEHWFMVCAAGVLVLAAAWSAVAAAAELGALLVHGRLLPLPPPAAVALAVVHPRAPDVGWSRTASEAVPPSLLLWPLASVLFAALLVPAVIATLRVGRWSAPPDQFKGQASRAEAAGIAGESAIRRGAVRVRPSIDVRSAPLSDMSLHLGELARDGSSVHMPFGNALGLIAAPQTGKTTTTTGVAPIFFPGPAIMTETHRPDVLAMSACQPGFDRPILVLDPENRVGWRDCIGVDVLQGCEDHAVARRRADLLIRAASARSDHTSANIEFFLGEATTAATAFLHAACLGECGLGAVLRWTQRWGSEEPVDILEAHRTSSEARSDAEMLRQLYSVSGPQAAGTAGELRNAFACLADPSVVETFNGTRGSLDVTGFLRQNARLYIHGSGREQRSIAPFVALVITEIVEEALAFAATSPHRRLDPPLLLDLDEVANIAPLPELPYYLSAGTGSGICTVWAAQGRAQLRRRWGTDAAGEIWQSTNFRLWFSGSVEAEDLRELADLSGEVWEESVGEQQPRWLLDRHADRYGRYRSLQRVPVLSADRLRTLPDWHAVLVARNAPAAELHMRPWWERRDLAGIVRDSMRTFESTVGSRSP